MRLEREPFSTAHLWDADTLAAYNAQPLRNGYHFQLDEKCTAAEKDQWRAWCRAYPNHWPRHVRDYIARVRGQK